MTETDTNCETDPCDAEASSTVTFPESDRDVENDYCGECLREIQELGVTVEGTYTPPSS